MQEHDYNEDEKIDDYRDPTPVPRIEKLFCMRCGHKLNLHYINPENLVEYYFCNDPGCVHGKNKCMLDFRHPVYPDRGPGESYALAWIK